MRNDIKRMRALNARIDDVDKLIEASAASMYEFRHQQSSFDIDLINAISRSMCPHCSGTHIVLHGRDRRGIKRYLCKDCNRHFTPLTNTLFEERKLPFSAWVSFLYQLLSYDSFRSCAREGTRSASTIHYWLEKVYLALRDFQDDLVLEDVAYLDETYLRVAKKDMVYAASGKKLRGISINQHCIGLALDRRGTVVCHYLGRGKPRRTILFNVFAPHFQNKPYLIHDKERAHATLVNKLNLGHEAHLARDVKDLPDNLNPLTPINNLCSRFKRFMGEHQNYNLDRLEDIANLFCFIEIQTKGLMTKDEKLKFLLEKMLNMPVKLPYRKIYPDLPAD